MIIIYIWYNVYITLSFYTNLGKHNFRANGKLSIRWMPWKSIRSVLREERPHADSNGSWLRCSRWLQGSVDGLVPGSQSSWYWPRASKVGPGRLPGLWVGGRRQRAEINQPSILLFFFFQFLQIWMWIKTYKTHQNMEKHIKIPYFWGWASSCSSYLDVHQATWVEVPHSGTMQVWPLRWLLQPWSIRQTLGWGLFKHG